MVNKMSAGYYGSPAHKKAIKDWGLRNPDKIRKIQKDYYHRQKVLDPKKFYAKKIWKERRRVSNRNGIPFEVSFDYIMALPSEQCPVFGVPLEWGTGSNNTASLDKIIPNKGYVIGNVVWMSLRANTLKRDASCSEIGHLYRWFNSV